MRTKLMNKRQYNPGAWGFGVSWWPDSGELVFECFQYCFVFMTKCRWCRGPLRGGHGWHCDDCAEETKK